MAMLHLADGNTGALNEEGIVYYSERAKGGFGLIFLGASRTDMEVDPQFLPSMLKNPMDYKRRAQTLVERAHTYGAKVFPQISMGPGRISPGHYAPSELPTYMPGVMSQAMTNEQVKKKIAFMVKGAALVKSSGCDGVEIHAMHWGHLLDQFAMSITNHRTDEYGGALENRLRVAKEIVEGIKQECGAGFPVSMRLALKSYMKGFFQSSLNGEDEAGRTLEETVKIAQMLEAYGYDALNVDVGAIDSFYYTTPPMYAEKGFTIPLAETVKKAVNIPVIAGGSRLNDPDMCEEALAAGKIDAISLGRASIADPYFPQKVQMGSPEKIRPCIGCNQACIGATSLGRDSSCAVNPSSAREYSYGIEKAPAPKKIAVVGGGVAGMELARTATIRGHEVSLYEKTDSLGGHLISGGHHSFKEDVRALNAWYQRELKELAVEVHTNTALNTDEIKKMDVDAVVFATGSTPITPNIPGIDDERVVSCIDALLGKKAVGQKVTVIGGGLVGCELALDLAKNGKQVTVVEELDKVIASGAPVPSSNRMMLIDLLGYNGVEILTGCRVKSINEESVVVQPKEGEAKTLEADTVIVAIGFKPAEARASELDGTGVMVYQIGDGRQVGNIMTAIWDAYEVARSI